MSDIDRILALEQQIKDQADYLDALANAVGAVVVAGNREALEARLAESSPARLGGFPLDPGVAPAGQTEPGFANVLADGSVTGPTIAPGALDSITKFAATIRPPVVVDSLPVLPSSSWPAGSIVYYTVNGLLYKTEDGVNWITVVDTADLTGTIGTTQIADNAISTPKLQANAVTTGKLAAGAVTANEIAANTITAGQIAAGAIATDELAANAVTTGKIAAGAVTAEKVAAQAIRVSAFQGDPANLCSNPDFEDGTGNTVNTFGSPVAGWTGPGSGLFRRMNFAAKSGSHSLQIQKSATAGPEPAISEYVAVTGQRRIRLSVWVQGDLSNSANAQTDIALVWYDYQHGLISSSSDLYTVGAVQTFVERALTVSVPSTAAFVRVYLQAGGASNQGDYVTFDTVKLYYVDDDVNHAGGDVAINSSGIAVTNGKITVTNPGSTVIIDGTSNMFKIAATGTLTPASFTNPSSRTATVTLATGFIYSPASMFFVETDYVRPVYYQVTGGTALDTFEGAAKWVSPNQTEVMVKTQSFRASGTTAAYTYRYYVLKEAGI